jgi:hypothetical protein
MLERKGSDAWHQRLCPCRAKQPCGESSGSAPPPLLQFSRTTQAQRPAVSHACLQLRRLELLIELATVSCVTRMMAHMPTRADVAPPPEGKQSDPVSPQGLPSPVQHTESLIIKVLLTSNVLCMVQSRRKSRAGRPSSC